MKNDITESEIMEVTFRKDRFYVKVKLSSGKESTMPRHVYSWLKSNPAFKEVPRGYAIHHLDYDKTNDDPSNLALMQKFHHMAHHFKSKVVSTEIKVDGVYQDFDDYKPNNRPTIHYHKPAKRYYLNFSETDDSGRIEKRRLWRDNGEPLLTKESAEILRDKMWKNAGEVRGQLEAI